MKKRRQLWKNIQAYNHKKSNIERRLEKEFLDHGIATIPCKVNGIGDILSSYSVAGYESLDSGFVEYINSIEELVPEKYPLVLSIVGHKFTPQEQETIRSTIEYDFAYNLGFVEEENKHHIRVFIGMTAGLVVTSIMLTIFNWWGMIPKELLFVFFWFFADVFVDYLLLEGWRLKKQRIKAARLACIKTVFSEEYDERDYSEEEAEKVFNDLYNNAGGK